ncbi:collagen alpha-1(I) chain-like [Budorcas taxicolor]|uniref:collagen alpha-1(I) chain-like n=1 Tax=Budorcas taxicolor TaxID=37181 RepID=UPI00228398E1|nr:collagen alpha-1(I) chain-like [Budorcas taxicolor]
MHLLPALLAAGPCPTCVQADNGTAGLEPKGSCPDAPKPPTRPGKFKERRGLTQPERVASWKNLQMERERKPNQLLGQGLAQPTHHPPPKPPASAIVPAPPPAPQDRPLSGAAGLRPRPPGPQTLARGSPDSAARPPPPGGRRDAPDPPGRSPSGPLPARSPAPPQPCRPLPARGAPTLRSGARRAGRAGAQLATRPGCRKCQKTDPTAGAEGGSAGRRRGGRAEGRRARRPQNPGGIAVRSRRASDPRRCRAAPRSPGTRSAPSLPQPAPRRGCGPFRKRGAGGDWGQPPGWKPPEHKRNPRNLSPLSLSPGQTSWSQAHPLPDLADQVDLQGPSVRSFLTSRRLVFLDLFALPPPPQLLAVLLVFHPDGEPLRAGVVPELFSRPLPTASQCGRKGGPTPRSVQHVAGSPYGGLERSRLLRRRAEAGNPCGAEGNEGESLQKEEAAGLASQVGLPGPPSPSHTWQGRQWLQQAAGHRASDGAAPRASGKRRYVLWLQPPLPQGAGAVGPAGSGAQPALRAAAGREPGCRSVQQAVSLTTSSPGCPSGPPGADDLSNCRCGLPDPLTSPGAVWPAPHLRSLTAYPHSPGSGSYSPETSPPLSEGLRPWSQNSGDDRSSATY